LTEILFQRRPQPTPVRSERTLTILSHGAMASLSIGLNLLPVFLTTLASEYGGKTGLTQ
jgi:hypothetical protein